MARFVFKLDSVLQHRLRLERQSQAALAEKLSAVAKMQDELRRLNDDLVQSTAALRGGHLVGKIDLAYLTAHRRYTADVTRRGSLLMQRLALAQRAVDEARQRLIEAARQRRILEMLRQKHLDRWNADQGRRDMLMSDEIATGMSHAMLSETLESGLEQPAGEVAP